MSETSVALAAGGAQETLLAVLGHYWHPVCSAADLDAGDPLGLRLLERDIVVARLGDGSLAALDDRCLHRSTRLSAGSVDGCALRCAYHGWVWSAAGECIEIPSLPDGPIPPKASIAAYDIEERYGLIWVRLLKPSPGEPSSSIPHCSAIGRDLHAIAGEPYTWPVSALRRVENFVDLAHFAWVHDGSLGRRDEPVPPLPAIERAGPELRFVYDPPEFDPSAEAMYGRASYRLPIPCTVDIEFELASGARRILWMTASPVDRSTCRVFWFMARDDDLEGDDDAHVAFQAQVLAEDEPVVCAQTPGEFPLDPGSELSVSTDLVSNVYRRWIREIVKAYASNGGAGLAAAAAWISADSAAVSESSSHDASTASSAMPTSAASS